MDDVHRLVVYAGDLGQYFLVVGHHLLELQGVARQHGDTLHHDGTRVLATAAVDGQQQRLGQIGARAEELDLLADRLIRHAACDTVIVAVAHLAHEVVVLVLDRAGVDRDLGAELLEALGQLGTPQHGDVGLGRRTEVIEGLEEAERGLGNLNAAVVEASADCLGHPRGIAREDVVVRLHAQMANHAELDYELVDKLLRERLVDVVVSQIVLYIYIEERRYVTQRHGGSVLLLHGGQISHVYPLHGLLSRIGGTTEIEAVILAHNLHILQGLDLLGHLLAQTDAVLGHGPRQRAKILLLGLDQTIGAIEGQTTIVADDTAAGIVVGQTRKESQRAERTDLLGVYVEHAVVVGLAVVGEDILNAVVDLHAVLAARLGHHVDAAEGLDGALEQLVGLKTHDQLVLLVDITRLVRGDGRNRHVVQRSHAVIVALLFQSREAQIPNVEGPFRRTFQERTVARVRRDVLTYEVAYVDLFFPWPVDKGRRLFHIYYYCLIKSGCIRCPCQRVQIYDKFRKFPQNMPAKKISRPSRAPPDTAQRRTA